MLLKLIIERVHEMAKELFKITGEEVNLRRKPTINVGHGQQVPNYQAKLQNLNLRHPVIIFTDS